MWAKKSDNVGLHDKDMIYTWYDAFNVYVAGLNTGNFAGYNDWRLPNIIELQSLVVYDGNNPAVDPAFDSGCTLGCTVTACSCTRPGSNYWTSTSYASSPALAWFVNSEAGVTNALSKNASFYVRAVRGGL